MPTHFQRSENNIYPHTPTTSPQKLARFLWNHRSLGRKFYLSQLRHHHHLQETHFSTGTPPPPPRADRGSDSVRGQGVYMLQRKTVGKASALGKRISRSETVRLVPLRLSTSGSVSYDATYTHSAPVRLPLLP